MRACAGAPVAHAAPAATVTMNIRRNLAGMGLLLRVVVSHGRFRGGEATVPRTARISPTRMNLLSSARPAQEALRSIGHSAIESSADGNRDRPATRGPWRSAG